MDFFEMTHGTKSLALQPILMKFLRRSVQTVPHFNSVMKSITAGFN